MDPVTQGALGAALPQSFADKRALRGACILGLLGGMAPDLDVLIRSPSDPLLFLEFHRHFTHALVFIPLGGLLCALVLHGLIGRRFGFDFKRSYLFCTAGYATHALLDACTTYGTLLLWPFNHVRYAWNTVSVIDPLVTVPLLVLVMTAFMSRSVWPARIALVWVLSYLLLGLVQRDRAIEAGYSVATQRGHVAERLDAKPSFANILVWKVVYELDDQFYVDAVRVGIDVRVYPGAVVNKLDVARDFPALDSGSQQAKDIERFRWFSNDYLAPDPGFPNRITDIRYSMIPNEVQGLWSIEIDAAAPRDRHVAYRTHRDASSERTQQLLAMLRGEADSGGQLLSGRVDASTGGQ